MGLPVDLASPLDIGRVTIPNRVFLAPMSGITDAPFRERALASGAGLAVSEMIASGELVKGRQGSQVRLVRIPGAVHSVQIAGREAFAMAEAARIAEGEGADLIDINMGCPAKKVTGGYCGSALMRDPDHALKLIEAVVRAVGVPVTLKTRLGWDETALNAPLIARRAETAGVQMITIHGRTREQFYKGKADWRAIRRVRDAVRIPVVANGDVATPSDAQEILDQSGADAVMIGRAHYGAPWAAGTIVAAMNGLVDPRPTDVCDYVVRHHEAILAHYGLESGLRQARKHLGWYLDRHASAAGAVLRQAILTSLDASQVHGLVRDAFDRSQERMSA